MQKTPQVDSADVLRVVKREFPRDVDEVLRILNSITGGPVKTHRLHLAHLKNSQGSLKTLHESLSIGDPRDVVSRAEYPGYLKRGWNAIGKLSPVEKQEIIDLDWEQYDAWLNAE